MDQNFRDFLSNITLTEKQTEDAKTKYIGVCKKLYSKFYKGEYDDSKKFLFGSYKTKTNIRPLSDSQDVDILFKIPEEVFDKYNNYTSNGQAALLQEIRNILKEKYTTTDKIKAWGKVVLIEFEENHHNVEVLPALEQDDKTFLIPNSENGGSWDIFDPRKELDHFTNSKNATLGLTRDLAKMLKAWTHNTLSMEYQSYKRLEDIINFLNEYYPKGKGTTSYAKIVFDYFDYMKLECDNSIKSHIEKALSRAQKAIEFQDNNKPREASEEWRKIFGNDFPLIKETRNAELSEKICSTPSRPWFA